ncbi:MAG: IspD/TarI family cytidylyltransferase, partial [Kiloniellales bacterium]|nr:IspD/TarI family cytidylyltransferase [Kiloniellales bacterium]
MPRTYALIVAAGRGTRVGDTTPKQYLPLAGLPLLRYSVARFLAHPEIDGVRVVIHPDDRSLYDECICGLELCEPVAGGVTRQESVSNGLTSLMGSEPDCILIHDGARPFVSDSLISRLISALGEYSGAIPALPVVDSLKVGSDGIVVDERARDNLWRAQTPQAFIFKDILR